MIAGSPLMLNTKVKISLVSIEIRRFMLMNLSKLELIRCRNVRCECFINVRKYLFFHFQLNNNLKLVGSLQYKIILIEIQIS